jgi:hypothetical protein
LVWRAWLQQGERRDYIDVRGIQTSGLVGIQQQRPQAALRPAASKTQIALEP